MAKKILVSITAMTPWLNKVKEIDKLGIKEAALFPTPLTITVRKELYAALEKTSLQRIPHVHLRDDCEEWELDYLVKRYGTEVFNVHPTAAGLAAVKRLGKYKDKIFIENLKDLPANFSELLNDCGGLCLDISHWEDFGNLQKNPSYFNFETVARENKIGVNHLSAVKEKMLDFYDPITGVTHYCYNKHTLEKLTELDYVKKYLPYLSDIISIELENSLAEQLEVKKYLEKIIL